MLLCKKTFFIAPKCFEMLQNVSRVFLISLAIPDLHFADDEVSFVSFRFFLPKILRSTTVPTTLEMQSALCLTEGGSSIAFCQ